MQTRVLDPLMGARITGWGKALPSGRLDNAELARRFDVSEEWIVQRTGISSRTIAEPGETTSSLAAVAGTQALVRAGMAASELDLVVVATCTPDHGIPAAAPLVQDSLGAGNAGAFDVNAACAGFLYALSLASACIEAGTASKILVCGSDVLSRVTDPEDVGSSILFGDGAGAVVVESALGPSSIGPFRLRSDGSAAELLCIPAGEKVLAMRGREVYRRAVEEMTSSVSAILASAGNTLSEVDLLIAHQANRRILEAVARRLGLEDDRVMVDLREIGNTSGGSIPIALCDAAESGRLDAGDLIVLTAIGAGLVWGAALLRWEPTRVDSSVATTVGAAHV